MYIVTLPDTLLFCNYQPPIIFCLYYISINKKQSIVFLARICKGWLVWGRGYVHLLCHKLLMVSLSSAPEDMLRTLSGV